MHLESVNVTISPPHFSLNKFGNTETFSRIFGLTLYIFKGLPECKKLYTKLLYINMVKVVLHLELYAKLDL